MIRFALIALALLFATSAEARQRHHAPMLDPGCNVIFPCTPMEGQRVMGMGLFDGIRSIKITMHRERRRTKPVAHKTSSFGVPSPSIDYTARRVAATIVEHPAGCPARAFCGCGAAVRVFGTPVRALWLAANWFRFPRAAPAPGMAAVRAHHVFVLEQHLGGDTWLAYDANSGGHQTRLHARSIAGYAIVNPHGVGTLLIGGFHAPPQRIGFGPRQRFMAQYRKTILSALTRVESLVPHNIVGAIWPDIAIADVSRVETVLG